ncbi:MAG TPA: sigma-70 family RNA polymerase sigma factor [Ktedonobacterales bacterium]
MEREDALDALVERAIARDHEAFGALYDLYFERIFRYVLLKVGEPAEAEDLAATVFLNAWRGIGHFVSRGPGSFGAWLFRLAHNALVDRYRHLREAAPLDEVDERDLPNDARDDPASVLDWRLTVEELRAALATLTEEQREVVLLRFVGELSAREVGEHMGKQEGTVRGLQFRAIDALRRALVQSSGARENRAQSNPLWTGAAQGKARRTHDRA